jgi:hypothetical protein
MRPANLTVLAEENENGLKVARQLCEVRQFKQLPSGGRMVDILALECPGEVVGDEDGVESCGEGRVDVGFGTVADHPRGAALAAMVSGETAVRRVMFFGQHLDGAEVRSEAGAAELVRLLGVVSLGDEDEAVTGGELGEGFTDAGKKFDLLVGDGLSEADDALVLVGRNRAIGKLLETGDERFTKTGQSVTTRGDGDLLNTVEALADLLGAVDTVVEIGDERGDGPLEVDIVLPQGVVSVDEQRLIGGMAGGMGFADHRG